jgi:hypothetical protein
MQRAIPTPLSIKQRDPKQIHVEHLNFLQQKAEPAAVQGRYVRGITFNKLVIPQIVIGRGELSRSNAMTAMSVHNAKLSLPTKVTVGDRGSNGAPRVAVPIAPRQRHPTPPPPVAIPRATVSEPAKPTADWNFPGILGKWMFERTKSDGVSDLMKAQGYSHTLVKIISTVSVQFVFKKISDKEVEAQLVSMKTITWRHLLDGKKEQKMLEHWGDVTTWSLVEDTPEGKAFITFTESNKASVGPALEKQIRLLLPSGDLRIKFEFTIKATGETVIANRVFSKK